MEVWMNAVHIGDFFIDFAVLGVLLVIGYVLQRRVRWIRANLIPANVLGGLAGFLIALTGISGNLIDSDRLGSYVYHLLALLFIALSLRGRNSNTGRDSIKIGLLFIGTYLVQAIVGLSIAFILIATFLPDLFAGIGLLMPLAFGMNPGIAYSIGQNWESYGFEGGGTVGLTMAALGFAVAYTVGIMMVKRGKRAVTHSSEKSVETATLRTLSADDQIFHWGLIGAVYLLTIGVLKLAEWGLIQAGFQDEALTLWSFHFIFAAVLAMLVRYLLGFISLRDKLDDREFSDNGNILMDFMVVASIAAITFEVIIAYGPVILLMSCIVAVATWFVVSSTTHRLFHDHTLERNVAVFGNMTGTMQSALVLLRIADPEHKSNVTYELVYGSGLALLFGFPLLLIINAPVLYFDNLLTGFGYALALLILYLALIVVALWRLRVR